MSYKIFQDYAAQNNSPEIQIEQIETDFFEGKINYKIAIERLKTPILGLSETERIEREKMTELFEAMHLHNKVNVAFLGMSGRLARTLKKKSVDITRSEANNFFNLQKDKEELIRNEKIIINKYEELIGEFKKNIYVDNNDLRLLILDLKYRQAERLNNDEERKQTIDKIDNDYEKLILDIANTGKKAEAITLWIVNRWLRKNGLDHAIYFFHALPREDHVEKTDCVLVGGDEMKYFDLKNLSQASDVQDYNQEVISRSQKKATGTFSEVFVQDSYQTTEALLMGLRNDLSKGQKIKYSRLINSLVENILNQLKSFHLPTVNKTNETEERLPSIKEIDKLYSGRDILIKLGYLAKEEPITGEKFLIAKRQLMADLKGKKSEEIRKKIAEIKKSGNK